MAASRFVSLGGKELFTQIGNYIMCLELNIMINQTEILNNLNIAKIVIEIIGIIALGLSTLIRFAMKPYIEKIFMTPAKKALSEIAVQICMITLFAIIYVFIFNDEIILALISGEVKLIIVIGCILLGCIGGCLHKKKIITMCVTILIFIGTLCINSIICQEKDFWDSVIVSGCIGMLVGTLLWFVMETKILKRQKENEVWIEHEKYGPLFIMYGIGKDSILCRKNLEDEQYVILSKDEVKGRTIYSGKFSVAKKETVK